LAESKKNFKRLAPHNGVVQNTDAFYFDLNP
jgi:hypothetical protein